MRIVLDLQSCQTTSRYRGIGRYTLSLAQAMARLGNGHEFLAALNGRFPHTVEPVRLVFDGLIPPESFVVFDVPGPTAEIDPANAWRVRAAELARESFLAALDPDIVHVTSLFEGLGDDAVTSIGKSEKGGLAAATLYDLIPLVRNEIYLSERPQSDWYNRKLCSLKNAEILLAISEYTRREAIGVLSLPEDSIFNISAAADSRFRPAEVSLECAWETYARYGIQKPFIMYAGGIDYRKNIEGLIEAFALLPQQRRFCYQLVVVCSIHDHDRRRLSALASRRGLGSNDVVFTDFVPDDDMVLLYSTCELFVFPSLHEGFGLPALEAMACGAAVIGSNTTSIPEVIGRKDALFDPTKPAAVAETIYRALTDTGFLQSLKAYGLKRSKLFSWEASARRALDVFEAAHARKHEESRFGIAVSPVRPRLAYLSPLPPARSGIADYSAKLLPELARFYDIEVVTDQEEVSDPWITSNLPVRSIEWFEAHAGQYDRVLYHLGNSPFHKHMFDLLNNNPGTVVLHDFFLGNVLDWMDHTGPGPSSFRRTLYESHGYSALIEERKKGRETVGWEYPCNKSIIEKSPGIIVHSRYALELADSWYGPGTSRNWSCIPSLHAVPSQHGRDSARKRLGLSETDFLVCSFGFISAAKLNNRLLCAWGDSTLSRDGRCRLVFVGENYDSVYGRDLRRKIAQCGFGERVRITGFVSPELYQAYLAAGDIAVQLRANTRGETSAAILDCLAGGLPLIANAHGSVAELPDDVLIKLDDAFSDEQLRNEMERLHGDRAGRKKLSRQAVRYVACEHDPTRIGARYHEAIEHFALKSPQVLERRLLERIAKIATSTHYSEKDLMSTADSIARNRHARGHRQLLIEVSELARIDSKTGIQRVVRSILKYLLNDPPKGFRVEPIYAADGQYKYARNFTLKNIEVPDTTFEDAPIETKPGDIYLGVELDHKSVISNESLLEDMRDHGVRLFFVVHDLLPIRRPHQFQDRMQAIHTDWLGVISKVSHGIVCISRTVADDLEDWLEERHPVRLSPLKIGYFHQGADIEESMPTYGLTTGSAEIFKHMRERPSLLMVGTIEPRKGHAQALAAVEQLWGKSLDVNLVIVGRQGWKVETLVKRLQNHPEKGRRLFWPQEVSDEMLIRLYESSSALLAASEGEGFGLPLIEAAKHGLPIIARELPVFREVAGDHAFYFSGASPDALADAIHEWLLLNADGHAPQSDGIKWLTWAQSARQLLDVLVRDNWYKTWNHVKRDGLLTTPARDTSLGD